MTRRALGRGLSALLTDKESDFDTVREELREIDLDLIDPNPEQPRINFSQNKLQELADSILENGLVQPILVKKKGNGRFQIVAGERRWRASELAGLSKINAIIRQIDDDKLLELALIENIQRQELNPIEEALAYQKLVNVLGLTQEEVAKRVGKDRSSVANYVRLLKLPEDIQKMLELEQLSMGHARALLGLDSPDEQSKLARAASEKKLSVREIERFVQNKSHGETEANISTPIKNDANIRAAELKLKRFLGTQVKITIRPKGGKININFGSASELDRIYSILIHKQEPPRDDLMD